MKVGSVFTKTDRFGLQYGIRFRHQLVPHPANSGAMLMLLQLMLIPKTHARMPATFSIPRTAMLAPPIRSLGCQVMFQPVLAHQLA